MIKLPDGTSLPQPDLKYVNPGANGFSSRVINFKHNVSTLSDESGSYTLTVRDGKRHLTAVEPDGEILFDGPIDTREQRAKAPKSVLKKVETLENPRKIELRGVNVNLDEFISTAPAPPTSN